MTTQTPAPSGRTAKERAAQVGDTAREQTAQVAGSAKEQALDVAHDAANQARDLLGELRQQLRQQTDTQRERLTELLDEFTDELETMADAGGRSGTATELVRQTAQRLRSVRDYVGGGTDVGTDLRRFASRRPGTFLVGAVVAGVLAGRATRGAAAVHHEQDEGGRVIDVRGGSGPSGDSSTGNGFGDGYGDGDFASATGSRFPTGTGYRQTDGESLARTGYPEASGTTETPIAREVAGDLQASGGTGFGAAQALPETGRVVSDYAVPTEPRTLTDEDLATDDDLSRDPNLGPAVGGLPAAVPFAGPGGGIPVTGAPTTGTTEGTDEWSGEERTR